MKNKKIVILMTLMFCAVINLQAQNEAQDPYPGDQSTWKRVTSPTFTWGSTDVRYSRSQPAVGTKKALVLNAWRGERVFAQAVVSTPKDGEIKIAVGQLKNGKHIIAAENIECQFVTYVIGDNFERNDSVLVADRLLKADTYQVKANTTRPIWLDIHVPQNAKPGKYTGILTASFDGKQLGRLPFTVVVGNHTLPAPKDWTFHLDLWQNPYAVARYFNVPLWSKKHFDLMRPIFKELAAAGEKVITCSIIQHPWNSQTYDPFESMIGKMKGTDGSWTYNYEVFDRWVEFMMSLGIDEQIDCYTLVPWHYRFDYYDMASNSVKYVACKPGEKDFEDFILPFLKDFASHLKQKGWFSRTCIAMDERPTDQLRAAYELVKRADPNYRIAGAFNYFPEVVHGVHDVSVNFGSNIIDEQTILSRKASGEPVTFYTCCGPSRPNTFTFSNPAEATFLAWHSAAVNYDGYLRWAFNSWTKEPTRDSRFITWPSGDCYLFYPEGSSIRFDRLIEGIQDYEKIRILRKTADKKKLQSIEEALKPFSVINVGDDMNVEAMLKKAKTIFK